MQFTDPKLAELARRIDYLEAELKALRRAVVTNDPGSLRGGQHREMRPRPPSDAFAQFNADFMARTPEDLAAQLGVSPVTGEPAGRFVGVRGASNALTDRTTVAPVADFMGREAVDPFNGDAPTTRAFPELTARDKAQLHRALVRSTKAERERRARSGAGPRRAALRHALARDHRVLTPAAMRLRQGVEARGHRAPHPRWRP
jgi:hypothetical protein